MPTIQEELRDAVRKKLEAFHDIKEVLEDDLNIVFSKNLNSMFSEGNHEGKKLNPITFKSADFKELFNKGIDIDKAIEKLQLHDIRTLHSFLSLPKGKNETTYDFFSVFLGFSGWLDFRSRYLDQKSVISKKDQSVIDPAELVNDETEINIIGTITINEEFVNRIKNGDTFTEEAFYTAKYDDKCQWYGIINDFDVIRSNYDPIKSTILTSLEEERTYKISSVIHGDGGSGKSCLLRRIAIDFHLEKFQILWLEDTYFDDFVLYGLHQIEQRQSVRFLLIIEDWYRTVSKSKNIGRFLDLVKSSRLKNLRIVIGDRELDENTYVKHVLKKDICYLDFSENDYLLNEIIKIRPEWAKTYEELFSKTDSLKSTSIFILLFILASIHDQNIKRINLSEPEKAFQNVILSDLKRLEKLHIGLAKALFNTAFIYSDYKLPISYQAFLAIAAKYSSNKQSIIYYKDLNLDCAELKLLRKYIHLSKSNKAHAVELVRFNHDLLVTPGFTEIKHKRWEDFNGLVKFQILDVFTTMEENYTPSIFLSRMIEQEPRLFNTENDKLIYIEKLIENKNWHQAYLMNLTRLKLEEDQFITLADKIFEKGIYANDFWYHYLKNHRITSELKTQLIELLLSNQKVHNRTSILRFFWKDIRIKELVRKIILNATITPEINNHFFEVCLNLCDDNRIKKNFAERLAKTKNVVDFIHPEIILVSLKILEGLSAKKEFCTSLLQQYSDIENINPKVLVQLLKNGAPELTKPLSQFILDQTVDSNKTQYDNQVIIQSLHLLSKDSDATTTFFENVFQRAFDALDLANSDLLIVSLKKCVVLDLKRDFSDWVLSFWITNPIPISENLLVECIKHCSDELSSRVRSFIFSIEAELDKG